MASEHDKDSDSDPELPSALLPLQDDLSDAEVLGWRLVEPHHNEEGTPARSSSRAAVRQPLPSHPIFKVMPLERRLPRAPFPRLLHSERLDARGNTRQAFLRLSQTHGLAFKDCRAVCAVHSVAGTQCTLTRGLRTHRYVAMLWAWLNSAEAFPSKEAHHAYIPTYQERVRARAELAAMPAALEFLEAEPAGEEAEPQRLPG